MSWAADELAGVALGDERLNRRVVKLLDRFAAQPTASIPGACGDWAETQAAYRFLANETVSWEAMLAAHWTSTRARMGAHAVVLCVQDTTELDFNGQSIDGSGPLTYEARRGLYLHPTYAVSLEREPLGVLDAWMWAREARDEYGERGGVRESLRWIEGYERLAELAVDLPRGGPSETRLVYVADREADIAELMATARDLGTPVDWLVRARHNRALPEGDKLWQRVGAGALLGEVCFTLPARHGHPARAVRQQVRAVSVELSDGHGGRVSASCIIAREVGAPAGIKPLEWRLLSNREVANFEQACQLIDWYRARWEIELFFHVLKNGCRVEALQLATIERVERALALYLVLAASGMAAGGRIVDYLKAMLEDPRHNVLFVGYQAPGTPGHAIQRYGPRGGWVELDGRRYTIRAGVDSISGYSAHADRDDLIRFVRGMRRWPRRIRLIHGDRGAREALRDDLLVMAREQGRELEVIIPERAV